MKKIILIILLIIFLGLAANFSFGKEKLAEINFFYSPFCPHCLKEKEFLYKLKEKYPEIEIKEYDLISFPENKEILIEFYKIYQVPKKDWGLVPVTFTPTEYFIGFNQRIGKEIESCIKECLIGEKRPPPEIKIPILGEIDLSRLSLPALTIILAALDGFNPCAMWILLFLIALLINAGSRKRIWLVGGTFILVSGIVYFLLLAAWLNLFLVISYVNFTRMAIGILALGFGTWQIKNFLKLKPGVCPVGERGIGAKIGNQLKDRAQKLVFSPLTLGIVFSVMILAIGINLVEFFCSAGLPATFTRILALNPLSTLSYYFYLFLYTFIFMLDDLLVFSLALITLRKIGFTDKYHRWSTLIGGLLIFILGILLIFKPQFLMFG